MSDTVSFNELDFNPSGSHSIPRKSKYSPIKKMLRSNKPWKRKASANFDTMEGILEVAKEGLLDISLYDIVKIHAKLKFKLEQCNLLIKYFGDFGKLDKCVMMYKFLLNNNYNLSIVTFNSLISRSGMWKNSSLAESFFDDMILYGIQPDIQIYNSLLNAYSKAGEIDKAVNLFNQIIHNGTIKPTVVTFNTQIDCYARNGIISSVNDVFVIMRKHGIKPNIRTFSSLIHAYCEGGQVYSAIEIMKTMEKQNIVVSSVTYSIVLHALGRIGNLELAFDMIEKMKLKNIHPNVVTLSSLIHACGKHKQIDKAFELYYEMIKSNVTELQPNSITGSSLVDICLKAGDVDRAFSVLNYMKEMKLELTEVTYTSLITELTRLQMLDRILEFALHNPLDESSISSSSMNRKLTSSKLFPNSAKSISVINPIASSYDPSTAIHTESTQLMSNCILEDLKNNTAVIYIKDMLTLLNQLKVSLQELTIVVETGVIPTDKELLRIFSSTNSSQILMKEIPNVKKVVSLLSEDILGVNDIDYIIYSEELYDKSEVSVLHEFENIKKDKSLYAQLLQDCNSVISSERSIDICFEVSKLIGEIIECHDSEINDHDTDIVSDYKCLFTMSPDVFIGRLSSMLAPLNEFNEAIDHYELIKSRGETPDKNTYNNLIQSLFEMSVKRSSLPLSSFRSQEQASMKGEDLFRLYLVFQEMRHNPKIQVDAPVYNTLIDACARTGDINRAIETVQSMREEGIEPNVITYTSLIKACSRKGGRDMIDLAEHLFNEMQQPSNHFSSYIAPTSVTYQHLIQGHFTVNSQEVNTKRILMLLDEMTVSKLNPSIKIYHYCLKAAIIVKDEEKVHFIINQIRSTRSFNYFDYHCWVMASRFYRSLGLTQEAVALNLEITSKQKSILNISKNNN